MKTLCMLEPHWTAGLFVLLLAGSSSGQRTLVAPVKPCPVGGAPHWSDPGGGTSGYGYGEIQALQFFGPRSARTLVAGGFFTQAGGAPVSRLASWDGASWDDLDDGVTGFVGGGYSSPFVLALARYQGKVLTGGHFLSAGNMTLNHVGAWKQGSGWEPMGGGMSLWFTGDEPPIVSDLLVHDDGCGPAVYACGKFQDNGGGIVRWDGCSSWEGFGASVVTGDPESSPWVEGLATFDDGSGPLLIASGPFYKIGGTLADEIARWDGSSWTPLGTGLDRYANAMLQFDDGSGPALYVTGDFRLAGGVAADNIARWDGTTWSAVGGGLDGAGYALAVHDDGSGPALYVGGEFHTAGGVPAERLARWDGTYWTEVGGGIWGGPAVRALASAKGCLAVGGTFARAGTLPVSNVALWGCTCP